MPDTVSTGRTTVRVLPIAMPDITTPGPWSKLAICAGENPDTFFPSKGDPGTRARQICARCPVRRDCAEYATKADESGIWGGLDQEQRRALALELAMNCANKNPVFSPEKETA
jgi:WhiB family transcriptional regulator, redox-sensing transcriptional regulator